MLVVKADRGLGCKSCEVACAVERSESKTLAAAIREHPAPRIGISVEQGKDFVTPLQCRQCADAPCVTICPTHALHRRDKDSPVVMDHELCVGCKLCVLACPFGVIRMDEDSHAIVKCDQCAERLERGEVPACVESCPTGALLFRSSENLIEEKRAAYLLTIERSTEKKAL